jgi:hypothetical protein
MFLDQCVIYPRNYIFGMNIQTIFVSIMSWMCISTDAERLGFFPFWNKMSPLRLMSQIVIQI